MALGMSTGILTSGAATSSREEVAHKVAWAAVKQKYEKVGNQWRSKS